MEQTLVVFDEHWLSNARTRGSLRRSNARTRGAILWAPDVLEHLATTGGIYLETLRQWFADFPLRSKKQKRPLKIRLESFDNDMHLGAVNELAWWVFMQRLGLQACPVAATSKPRPDFHVQAPAAF